MTAVAADDASDLHSRTSSVVGSIVSDLDLATQPCHLLVDVNGGARCKRPSRTNNVQRCQEMDFLKVPRGQTNISFSTDDPRRVSAAPSILVPPSEAILLPEELSEQSPIAAFPLPSLGQCAVALVAVLWLPLLVLGGTVVGLCVIGGHLVTQWHAVLYAGLSLAMLGSTFAIFAFWLRRFLQRAKQRLLLALIAVEGEELNELLTGENCLDYILGLVHREMSEAETKATTDPLDFVQKELDNMLHSSRGLVVVNTTGVILWANLSLCQFFGYEAAELLQENIRLLMPHPYAGQHDHFIRRHLRSGVRTVLGGSREVPVLRRDGTQDIALLSLDDRVDMRDSENRLFFGTFDFGHGELQFNALKAQLRTSEKVDPSAFLMLDGAEESMVAINAQGIILYCNRATTQLFRWERGELIGNNVSILMAEPFASAHNGFLRSYVERDEQCWRQGQPQMSGIVGSGRDVMAQDRTGQRLRIFLMVHRADLKSGRAAECVFLAKMVHIGAADTSTSRHSSMALVSAASPTAMQCRALARWTPLPLMRLRRCTVVLLEVRMLDHVADLEDPEILTSWFEPFLILLSQICAHHKGLPQWVMGCQLAVLFNSSSEPNAAHRSSAAAFMLQMTEATASSSMAAVMEVRMSAVSVEVFSAKWDAQEILSGDVIDLAAALLRVQKETQVSNPVIDGTLFEEVQYTYTCRLVNRLVVRPDTAQDRVVEVFELISLKSVGEDEWMYQLRSEENKASSWAYWQQAWVHLPAPLTSSTPSSLKGRLSQPSSPSNAMAAFQQHLTLWPQDTAGQLLVMALQGAAWATALPERVERCGVLPFRLQYCVARQHSDVHRLDVFRVTHSRQDACEIQVFDMSDEML